MCALQVNLRRDEEMLSRTEWAVLTNQRLVASLNRKNRNEITDDVPLSDIATFKKTNGGQQSRMRPGLISLGIGAAISILQAIPPLSTLARANEWLELIMFLAGAAGVLIGLYLIIGSAMRIKPFTVVVFTVVGARDIPVHFPGADNPDADDMTRKFVRAKRGI